MPKLERLADYRGVDPDAVPPADPPDIVGNEPDSARDELSGHMHGHLLGDGDRRPDGPLKWDDSYRSKVGQFEQMWQQHIERWPDRPRQSLPDQADQADQAMRGDPPGSWRGDGGRYLTPDQNAAADRRIAELRAPEPAITADLCHIEHRNPSGGYLVGLEHRLKGDQRLKEKIADAAKNELGSSTSEVVPISDAVRYTFCFDRASYLEGYGYVGQRLEALGYQMVYSKNRWLGDPQYKGVNTRWENPDGARFEVQFHTPESFHAKEQLTHRSYQRLRSPGPDRLERQHLVDYQQAICSALPEPADISAIKDYRKDSDA